MAGYWPSYFVFYMVLHLKTAQNSYIAIASLIELLLFHFLGVTVVTR